MLNLSNGYLPEPAKQRVAGFLDDEDTRTIKEVSKTFSGKISYVKPTNNFNPENLDPNSLPKGVVAKSIFEQWPTNFDSLKDCRDREKNIRKVRSSENFKNWDTCNLYGEIGLSMDSVTLMAHVQKKISEFRKNGTLLFRSEFEKLSKTKRFRVPGKGRECTSLERVWGAEYLRKKLEMLKEKGIEQAQKYHVPKYIIVVEDDVKTLNVNIKNRGSELAINSISSSKVYVEEIESKGVALGHEWLKKSVKYTDYGGPENILKDKDDNFYIVDTEPFSINGGVIQKENSTLKKLKDYLKLRTRFYFLGVGLETSIPVKLGTVDKI